MPRFSTTADELYSENNPPLIADNGISKIGSNSEIYGATSVYEKVQFDSLSFDGRVVTLDDLFNAGFEFMLADQGSFGQVVPTNIGISIGGADGTSKVLMANIMVQSYWSLRFSPYVNGNSTEINSQIVKSYSSSSTDTQSASSTLQTSLSASAGLSFGGFNASISGSLTSSLDNATSSEQSSSQTDTETEDFTLPAATAAAVWEKRMIVSIEFQKPYLYILNVANADLPAYMQSSFTDGALEDSTPISVYSTEPSEVEVISIQSYIDTCSLDSLPE